MKIFILVVLILNTAVVGLLIESIISNFDKHEDTEALIASVIFLLFGIVAIIFQSLCL